MHLKKEQYFSIWDSNIGSGMAKNKITPLLFLILSLLRKKGMLRRPLFWAMHSGMGKV